MFRVLLVSLAVLSVRFAAQSQTDITKIIPPSPDASSLGKFAETPVSHYTGVPNIQVPIWQLSNGDLNLNIELSYHAGGTKVEEIASCVGLNWSLNAGGVITRSVVGLPDDYAKPGRKGLLAFSDELPYDIADLGIQSNQERFNVLSRYVNGCIDTESDSYFFNFAGITGKFGFDWEKNIQIGSNRKIEIVPTYDSNDPVTTITKWTVRTEDGTKYIFATRENSTQENTSEQSTSNFCSGRPMTYTSSWYLTEIVSPNNTHTITFNYVDYTIDHGFSESESFSHKITDGAGCPGQFTPLISVSNSTLSTNGKRISTISSSNGFLVEMLSNAIAARTDVQGNNLYSIDRVLIKYNGTVIKNFYLDYDFSNGGRLTLKSLYEKSFDGLISKPPYQFFYNQTQLPPRASKQQDYWGYFNTNSEAHLVPSLAILAPTGSYAFFSGANRNPDAVRMKAGILEKIIYPTGGSQSFEYEPHEYGYVQSDNVMSLNFPVLEDASASVIKTGNNVNSWNSQNIVITHKVTADVNVQFSEPPLLGDISTWMYPKVKITNSAGIVVFQKVYQEGAGSSTIVLNPDTYTISAFAFAANGGTADEAILSLNWKKPAVSQNTVKNLMAGGLRIKKITYSDEISNTPDILDEFAYVMREDESKSSGVLLGEVDREAEQGMAYDLVGRLPFFVHEYGSVTNTTQPLAQCFYLNRFSANRAYLGTTNGSHIAYREVVHYRSSSQNGKTIYIFDSPYEFNDGISNVLPFPPAESFDHKRGLLRRKLIYQRNEAGDFQLTAEESYSYSYHLLNGLQMKAAAYVNQSLEDAENFKYSLYLNNLGYNFLLSKEVKNYQNGSTNTLSIIEEFQFNPIDKQLKIQKVTDSQGQLVTVNFNHPQDFAYMNNPIINSLISKHQYGSVLKRETFNGEVLKHGVIAEFSNFTDLLLPSRILHYETAPFGSPEVSESPFSDRNYKEREKIERYDNKGNILQSTLADGTINTYLWGYNSTYPVAEVKNATYQQVQNALGIVSPTIDLGSGTLSPGQIALMKTSLPGAFITTYGYAPYIGRISTTDPNGITTFYEYDDFRRLKLIKDNNGNVVKQISYEYKDQ